MEIAGVSFERLEAERERADRVFVENFAEFSRSRRVLVFVDTTDALPEQSEAQQYLLELFSLVRR